MGLVVEAVGLVGGGHDGHAREPRAATSGGGGMVDPPVDPALHRGALGRADSKEKLRPLFFHLPNSIPLV